MFESLDSEMVAELMKLDAFPTLKKETRLADLIGCLEQAAQECRSAAVKNGLSTGRGEEAANGINAAQRIVERIWKDRAVG